MATTDPAVSGSDPADAVEADRLESRVVDLALSGALAAAGHEAIAADTLAGLPRTVSRDGQLLRLFADGRTEVLAYLPRVPFTRPPNVRLLEPK